MPNSKQKNKEKMTLDKLAQMTANGFFEVEKKIDKVEMTVGKIEKRIDKVEDVIIDLKITTDRKLNSMEEKIESGINKILIVADSMASQFSDWKQENAFGAGIEQRQTEQLQNHEKRIVNVEQKLKV